MILQRHDAYLIVGILSLVLGIGYSGIFVPNISTAMFSFGISITTIIIWLYQNFMKKEAKKDGN